jgi:hypothetical protein
MASDFPTSKATLRRILPGDYMDGSGTEIDLAYNAVATEIEAIEQHIGVTGSVVAGTIEKRLADTIAVADGAAAGFSAHELAADPHAQYLRQSDIPAGLISSQSVSLPSIGWDSNKYPITPSYSVGFGGSMRGSAGITPEALFDLFSVARTAPTNTYYVDIATGSDSNAGTSGSKFKSIRKAIDAGNTAAAPFKVFVTAGEYDRVNTFYGNPGTTPTQDCAFIAVGGTVVCGTWDSFTASADGTHTNTYSFSLTNVIRCLDLLNKNPDGTYNQLVNVATAALCNLRPGSWASVAGAIYVNRGDGAAVTTSNTRVLRQAPVLSLPNTAQVSVYVGGDKQDCGWEMHGSDTVSTLSQICTTVTASDKALVVKNCAFRHAGGFGAATARCVTVDSYPGIAAFFDCACSISASDGFNFKHTVPASPATACLTVNCSGAMFGETGSTSNNGWTLHNDVIGIDICGRYRASAGGTVHNINTSKAALIGTTIADDAGDRHFGGTINPTAVRAANTAEIQMYGCAVLQPYGLHLHARDTAVIVTDSDVARLRVAGNVTTRQ